VKPPLREDPTQVAVEPSNQGGRGGWVKKKWPLATQVPKRALALRGTAGTIEIEQNGRPISRTTLSYRLPAFGCSSPCALRPGPSAKRPAGQHRHRRPPSLRPQQNAFWQTKLDFASPFLRRITAPCGRCRTWSLLPVRSNAAEPSPSHAPPRAWKRGRRRWHATDRQRRRSGFERRRGCSHGWRHRGSPQPPSSFVGI
jgi:hypothetical protein